MYCAHFRQHVYVTPKHYKRYLSFLNGYKNLYSMKLVEELMFANKIGFSAGSIAPNWVDVFLKGGASLDITSVKKKPKEWIPTRCGSTSSPSRASRT